MELLKKTKSICPECFKEINALVYQKDNKVYMKKKCETHGEWEILLEKDATLYAKLMHKEFNNHKNKTIEAHRIPITHKCNLNCNACFFPYKQKHLPLDYIKKHIDNYNAKLIKFSGGEPTMRKDLPELIKYTNKKNKIPILCTNGIKLSNKQYARKLKNAGLRFVSLPLNSLDEKIEQKIVGKRILKYKLKALKNLKKNNIKVMVGSVVVKGVNEGELKRVLKYCLDNTDFIMGWKIKSGVPIGRYNFTEQLNLSEIIDMVCKIENINMENIIKSYSRIMNLVSIPCKFCLYLVFNKHKKNMELLFAESNQYAVHSKFQKLFFGYRLVQQKGIIKLIEYLKNEIRSKNKIIVFPIEIRCWPTKYTIDLKEMSYCTSTHLAEEDKIYPSCYGLVLNEKSRGKKEPV